MEKSQWGIYHDQTKTRPPRQSLIDAVKLVSNKCTALDLGAGALTESRYLLEVGFEKVIAVDSEASVEERGREIIDDRFEMIISTFEKFNFLNNTFDLVNAQYSLPFMSSESFDLVFQNIKASLKPEGIFVGQLFGKNDDWKDREGMTFHSLEEIQALFSDMQVINLQEEERAGTTAAGSPKYWHLFHITARKKF